jgi:hypothetical protein
MKVRKQKRGVRHFHDTRLGIKDTGEWARKEVDLDEEVARDGGDYGDESRDGEDEEEFTIDCYDSDSDSVAGKHWL